MRNTFINRLVEKAKKKNNIILIVGDLGFSVVEPFANEFPDRFINAGVAEQNMTGIAAGLASEGYHVFTYSIANFPTFRCAEQIRNDIDYHNLPVTVVSVGGGLAYGNLGYSHHAVQDFSLMRSFPNVLIHAPADPFEMDICIDYLVDNPQPSYLRINKAGENNLFPKKPNIIPGEPNIVKGNQKAKNIILSTGAVLDLGIKIWMKNDKIKEKWAVGSVPIWGERVRESLKSSLSKYEKIISIEEHLLSGGFGSFLLESGLDCKIICIDNQACGEVGDQKYLKDKFGLNSNILIED